MEHSKHSLISMTLDFWGQASGVQDAGFWGA